MALFGFGKTKERKSPACACGSGPEAAESAPACRREVCSIKVLGSGCASCHALYENAQAAARAEGLSVEVEYITDLQTVMEYGVMTMPALVVNETVVSAGKVLKAADVQKLLRRAEP